MASTWDAPKVCWVCRICQDLVVQLCNIQLCNNPSVSQGMGFQRPGLVGLVGRVKWVLDFEWLWYTLMIFAFCTLFVAVKSETDSVGMITSKVISDVICGWFNDEGDCLHWGGAHGLGACHTRSQRLSGVHGRVHPLLWVPCPTWRNCPVAYVGRSMSGLGSHWWCALWGVQKVWYDILRYQATCQERVASRSFSDLSDFQACWLALLLLPVLVLLRQWVLSWIAGEHLVPLANAYKLMAASRFLQIVAIDAVFFFHESNLCVLTELIWGPSRPLHKGQPWKGPLQFEDPTGRSPDLPPEIFQFPLGLSYVC